MLTKQTMKEDVEDDSDYRNEFPAIRIRQLGSNQLPAIMW